jgi:Tfp pilus assembly protein PilW
MKKTLTLSNARQAGKRSTGFSLVELLVAMAVFMVIGGAALLLVRRHVPLYTTQQNQAGLNITMRNVATQMQIEAVNAGSGYLPGANVAAWPVGITLVNNAGGSCYNAGTNTYGAGCFDQLNIITVQNIPSARPAGDAAGTTNANLTSSTLYLIPTDSTKLTDLKNSLHAGDKILLLTQSGQQMTTTSLKTDATVSGAAVQLSVWPTDSTGKSTTGDPFTITDTDATDLKATFSPYTDWALKLAPITYCVDTTTDANSPALRRVVNYSGTCKNTDGDVVANQMIGFRVGAYVVDGSATNDNDYNFNRPATPYKWGAIRSLRVSMIARTSPDPTNPYRNSFDQGPYKVEALSVIINPRNLSMNDN